MLLVAERYGRAPEEVEQWDEYWFNRAVEYLEGEGLHYAKEKPTQRKKR